MQQTCLCIDTTAIYTEEMQKLKITCDKTPSGFITEDVFDYGRPQRWT